jgi:hypothetical protein
LRIIEYRYSGIHRWYEGIVGSIFSGTNEIHNFFILVFFSFPSRDRVIFFKFQTKIFISNFKNVFFQNFLAGINEIFHFFIS